MTSRDTVSVVDRDKAPASQAPTWRCATCGAQHEGLVVVFGPPAPEPWAEATDLERSTGEINADTCAFEDNAGNERFFLRGQLEIPVPDLKEGQFVWSVWVELTAEDMELTAEHWLDPRRAELAATAGTLATELPYDPPTRGLPVRLFTRRPGVAPFVEVDPAQEHPLVEEQRHGITTHQVAALNGDLLG